MLRRLPASLRGGGPRLTPSQLTRPTHVCHPAPITRHYSRCVAQQLRQASTDEATYHSIADSLLESLTDACEQSIEDTVDAETDFDVSFSSGVLSIRLPAGTWVLNKQAPNRQVWLSSPYTGPRRFGYREGQWVDERTGDELLGVVKTEILEAGGGEIMVDAL